MGLQVMPQNNFLLAHQADNNLLDGILSKLWHEMKHILKIAVEEPKMNGLLIMEKSSWSII